MPPTLITRDADTIRDFRNEFGDIILKPLYGNGGAAVFRLREDDENLSALLELFLERFREAVRGAALSAGRAPGRQAHHPDRRRSGRRDQPHPGDGRRALQHACRRQGGGERR